MIKRENLFAYILLCIACVIWGVTFVPQKTAMQYTGPMSFSAARLLLGAVFLIISSVVAGKRFFPHTIKQGSWLGVLLFLGSSTQQIGVQYTTATNAGFITGLYLLIVPIQITIVRRKHLSLNLWAGVLFAVGGLWLLCLSEGYHINSGDLWVLLCAFLFAQHIIFIDKVTGQNEALPLAATQFTVAGLLSLAVCIYSEPELMPGIPYAWKEILFAGLISAGIAYTIQLYAQRFIPATEAALICSLEAVFAALAGGLILGESMTMVQFFGCNLMFLGIALACFKPKSIQVPIS